MNDYFQRLFEHVFWADTHVLALIEGAPGARVPALPRLFAHLLAAERIWLLRLQGEDSGVQPAWPELTIEQLRSLATSSADGYARYLDELQDVDLAADVVYNNSQGIPFRNTVCDILTHVALHGSYHRGQIAAAVRAGRGEPVNTDFIAFVRGDNR
jgi:uncharacterized damage-inducible protein DinB